MDKAGNIHISSTVEVKKEPKEFVNPDNGVRITVSIGLLSGGDILDFWKVNEDKRTWPYARMHLFISKIHRGKITWQIIT